MKIHTDRKNGIFMPSWITPRIGWTFTGWFPNTPIIGSFDELVKNAKLSDHGELREVDIYPEGVATWYKEK